MAYFEVCPKSAEVQQQLEDMGTAVMHMLQQAAKDLFGVPDSDIIIELNQCSVIAFNPTAIQANATPQVVIKIATSDHILQPKFAALCARIVDEWNLLFEEQLVLEVWVNLIDAWGCSIDFN